MIEIEKKFLLSEEETQKLIKGSKFVGEIRLEDTYYDLLGFSMMKHDKYLRSRNGKFELKLPAGDRGKFEVDRYREIENETEISKELSLGNGKIKDELREAGYFVVAQINSVRKKYKMGEFTVDIDVTDFGYNLAEVELMASSEGDIEDVVQRILSFAREAGIKVLPKTDVRRKLLEYLYRQKPEVYEEIVGFWRSTNSTRL